MRASLRLLSTPQNRFANDTGGKRLGFITQPHCVVDQPFFKRLCGAEWSSLHRSAPFCE